MTSTPCAQTAPPGSIQWWEARIVDRLAGTVGGDPAHDLDHVVRVWRTARALSATEEPVNLLVILAASLLHDIVNLSKDHPDRARASALSADRAVLILRDLGFPAELLPGVAHAIVAHSYSAAVPPRTREAMVVQDADRLESLGAIGIARTFSVGGALRRPLLDSDDPLAARRPLDDKRYSLDHFEAKLLKLPATMNTEAGRARATERARYLAAFRDQLVAEIMGDA
jgi:uncharacterized protein